MHHSTWRYVLEPRLCIMAHRRYVKDLGLCIMAPLLQVGNTEILPTLGLPMTIVGQLAEVGGKL